MSQFLSQVRDVMCRRHYSIHTENAYVDWIRRFIIFHGKRHPGEMGEIEISQFLSHLARDRHVAASTQNQALNALVFLYKQVLRIELGDFGDIERSRKPQRLPTVMTKEEVGSVLVLMTGKHQLMAKLLYGCGLRLSECIRLRVKDIDFGHNKWPRMAREMNIDISHIRFEREILLRTRATKTQVGMNNKERRNNLRGAFRVKDPSKTREKRIILADDVLTTGSTGNECAWEMLRHGARQVDVLTLAQTEKRKA